MSDGSILTKTFGSGIAYPTFTNDGMIVPDRGHPRADSFSLYCNWVANRVLLNILPKTQLDSKLHQTMRSNRKKAIESNPNNNNNKQSPKKTDAKPKTSPEKPKIKPPEKTSEQNKTPVKKTIIKSPSKIGTEKRGSSQSVVKDAPPKSAAAKPDLGYLKPTYTTENRARLV